MAQTFNVYCDESCHLEHDRQKAMVLGAVWCPLDKRKGLCDRIKEIKVKHGLGPNTELKWVKLSKAKEQLYLDILDFFFDDESLGFRAIVIPDKTKLDHEKFNQTHDQWYYKMYFEMLRTVLSPENHYNIYLDIKDTCGAAKVRKLHEVLCNSKFDFSKSIVEKVQTVRSHEIELMQVTDLLIGALSYLHRGLSGNTAKVSFIQRMRKRSGYSLKATTLYAEKKMNLMIWQGQE
jgi:hypothetical protein